MLALTTVVGWGFDSLRAAGGPPINLDKQPSKLCKFSKGL